MKLATIKLLTFFVALTLLANTSALLKKKLPDGTAFGYASNENILQNSSVNKTYLFNKIKNYFRNLKIP